MKRSSRALGLTLIGIELGSADDLEAILRRMRRSRIVVETSDPESATGRFLVS